VSPGRATLPHLPAALAGLVLHASIVLAGQLSAATTPDAPAAPLPGKTTPGASLPVPGPGPGIAAPSPFLGVSLDHPSGFDADQGLLVTGVVAKSTFDHLGVRVGDHVLSVNGTSVNTVAAFSTIAEALTIGQTLTLTVRTDDALRTISGAVEAISRPREISQKTQQLANEVADLKNAVQGEAAHASLTQSLLLLKQLEADLPGMVDAFKSRYPQGEFDISIHIDILSDRTAAHAQPVAIPPLPSPSNPAAAPSGASAALPGTATAPPASSPPKAP